MEIEPATLIALTTVSQSFYLAHFRPMLHFHTLQQRQKVRNCSNLLGGTEKGNWPEMGQCLVKTEACKAWLLLSQLNHYNQRNELDLSVRNINSDLCNFCYNLFQLQLHKCLKLALRKCRTFPLHADVSTITCKQ